VSRGGIRWRSGGEVYVGWAGRSRVGELGDGPGAAARPEPGVLVVAGGWVQGRSRVGGPGAVAGGAGWVVWETGIG
jgi:hypothetical protein